MNFQLILNIYQCIYCIHVHYIWTKFCILSHFLFQKASCNSCKSDEEEDLEDLKAKLSGPSKGKGKAKTAQKKRQKKKKYDDSDEDDEVVDLMARYISSFMSIYPVDFRGPFHKAFFQ